MTVHANDRLLIDAFPRLEKNAQNIARRYPRHLRDELVSELLVRMVTVARRWNGYGSFEVWMTYKLTFEAIDWWKVIARRPETWSLIEGDLDTFAHRCPDGPYRSAVVREILERVAELPPRWQIALLHEDPVAMPALGVTAAGVSHMRRKGRARLRGLGVHELVREAA